MSNFYSYAITHASLHYIWQLNCLFWSVPPPPIESQHSKWFIAHVVQIGCTPHPHTFDSQKVLFNRSKELH